MESEYDPHPDFGITPAQYHHGLSKLWDALNMPGNPTGEDIFTLAARAIEDAQQRPSRREIAAMAMQGMLATPGEYERAETIAQWAVDQADALIERLNVDPAEGVSR
jgi:chloramphenicol 3-O-phosphotransferase